ncbi:MAG: hypothetical protein Q4G07_00635 [Oscillospiraceae bacterium]|nr:hypothetical protein [Oscillospiraceae bacterium]
MIAICLAAALCGCASPFGGGEELLASPQLTLEQQQIAQALQHYLNEEARLKYPRQGENLAPFIFCDLDGDGAEEAVAFYTIESRGKNVQLALLTQKEGRWAVSFDMEGDNTDLDRISLASVFQNGATQLVVGYTSVNLSDKALAVYSCSGGELKKEYEQPYDHYETADLTGNGFMDVAAVSAGSQPGLMQLTLLSGDENGLTAPVTTQLSTQFTSCINFLIGKNEVGEKILVVDGYNSGDRLTTEVLKYVGGVFTRYAVIEGQAFSEAAARNQNVLLSMDVDGDGMVEVPSALEETGSLPEGGRFCWTGWYGFKEKKAYAKYFALVDTSLNCALLLPEEWKGQVTLEKTALDNEWRIRRTEDGAVLLYIRQLSQEDALNAVEIKKYKEVCTVGDYSILVRTTRQVSETQAAEYFQCVKLQG